MLISSSTTALINNVDDDDDFFTLLFDLDFCKEFIIFFSKLYYKLNQKDKDRDELRNN